MDPKKLEILVDKLQKDFEQMLKNLDKGLDLLFYTPHPDVGVTPKQTVYKERRLKVYRYKKYKEKTYTPPLLVINSLINGYYILDLMPGFSLIDFLLSKGIDIYTMHWDTPDPDEKEVSFDYYITGYIHNTVEEIKKDTGVDKVNIIGYCMGGNLGMLYSALYPENINSFISLAAPIDFTKAGVLSVWANSDVINVEQFVDAFGNLPTYIMDMVFPMIKPSQRIKAMSTLFKNPENNAFSNLYKALMQWREDNQPMPGKFTKKYLKEFYQDNKLYKGQLKVNDKKVDLKKITCPVLNIVATDDYITPEKSALPFLDMVGSKEKELLEINGGHLDIILNVLVRNNAWEKLKNWIVEQSNKPE
jgi:polyhydroxyalkanoate synthase